jgi:hypothetical protein
MVLSKKNSIENNIVIVKGKKFAKAIVTLTVVKPTNLTFTNSTCLDLTNSSIGLNS